MNKDIDIGNYKPEELQLRNGNEVIAIFKNVDCYLVIHLDENDEKQSLYVAKDGRFCDDERESKFDVILKNSKNFNLGDYLDKLELLETTNGSKILNLYKDSKSSSTYNFLLITESEDTGLSWQRVNSKGKECSCNGDVILQLKTKSKPKTIDFNQVWEKFLSVYGGSTYKLMLFDDQSGRIDKQNRNVLHFLNFEDLLSKLEQGKID